MNRDPPAARPRGLGFSALLLWLFGAAALSFFVCVCCPLVYVCVSRAGHRGAPLYHAVWECDIITRALRSPQTRALATRPSEFIDLFVHFVDRIGDDQYLRLLTD